jgi:hypothetical protein
MPSPTKPRSIRRIVALPPQLVEEALRNAPEDIRGNFNRLVILSLQEYIANQKAAAFERAMIEMAADPIIRVECIAIAEEFMPAEMDGL